CRWCYRMMPCRCRVCVTQTRFSPATVLPALCRSVNWASGNGRRVIPAVPCKTCMTGCLTMLRTKLVSLLVLAVLFAVLGGFFWVGSYLHRPLASEQAVVVEVPAGGTLSGLMRDLSSRGLLGEGMPRQLRRVAVKGFDLFTGVS